MNAEFHGRKRNVIPEGRPPRKLLLEIPILPQEREELTEFPDVQLRNVQLRTDDTGRFPSPELGATMVCHFSSWVIYQPRAFADAARVICRRILNENRI